ncbi:alpha-L-rhamnosidase [Terricaulis silvestris]|nr:alpha-L-rhamnosidase [Terricaulis silvestris]
MGLIEPADWTATWLAAEDEVARADRRAGLHWIWGDTSRDQRPRYFRLKFSLRTPSSDGVFYVGTGITEQLRSVRVDGTSVDLTAPKQYAATRPAMQELALGPMSPGEHVLAIEMAPTDDRMSGSISSSAAAMAPFVRIHAIDGSVVRLTGASGWTTNLEAEPGWFGFDYDDASWMPARPSSENAGEPWPAKPAALLRKEFRVEKPIRSARLYATALGFLEARLNGQRVGDAVLTPEVSDFRKRLLYRTYDVTPLINDGSNVLGVIVGDGWYAGPITPGGRYPWGAPPSRILAQLELTYDDGLRETINTDCDWRTSDSAIRRSEIYNGEVYDGRYEQAGWDTIDFDDTRWAYAEAADRPTCELAAQCSPPIRATQTLKATQLTNPAPGVYVFDFGQNFAGWCRLRTKGPVGARVELRFAELLTATGEVDQSNLRGAEALDVFILAGHTNGETFEPKFTYHGFRYVQIVGLPTLPTLNSVEGIVVHSDLAVTGRLFTDNALIQQIWRNAVWTQRSNLMGVFTDCPQRDERLPWLADPSVFYDAAAFNMDVAAFTRRQLDDVRTDQSPNGNLPALSPGAIPRFNTLVEGAPGWADASITFVWSNWRRYGDNDIIRENWSAMTRFLQYLEQANPDYIWRSQFNMGDWLAVDATKDNVPTTPYDLVATANWASATERMGRMATAIGRIDDADNLQRLHAHIRSAFIAAFVGPDGIIGNGSQTSYVLALQYGLVPEGLRAIAAERLADNIRVRGTLMTTGIFGTAHILDVLVDAGYSDLAYDLLLRTDYPSWGYMIAKGATTIWERWNGDQGNLAMNSYNHPALGSVCGFLFRRVAGVHALEPGFKKIAVRPVLNPRVRRGGADYDSVVGRISTAWWQHSDLTLHLDVTIPANTEAVVSVPARPSAIVREGGRLVDRRTDMRIERRLDHEIEISIGSGTYHFRVSD